MIGEAVAYGVVTIVSALATGKGAAFGIDLWTKAKVNLTNDDTIQVRIMGDENENPLLAEKSVRVVLDRFGIRELGARIETESNIPIARGLKSSSVAGNAIVLATLTALQKRLTSDEILNLVVQASLEANVTVTGAFDDAAASLYGNVVVTDNTLRKILRTFPVEDYTVILVAPSKKAYTSQVDLKRIKTVAEQVEIAHKEALTGNYWNAMTLNGLVYSHALRFPTDIIIEGIQAGALAAGISGKGPAVAFVVEEHSKDAVLDVLKESSSQVIVTRTRNWPSSSRAIAES